MRSFGICDTALTGGASAAPFEALYKANTVCPLSARSFAETGMRSSCADGPRPLAM